MKKALILLLRQDPESLTANRLAAIAKSFPEGFEVLRVDPPDYKQHADLCEEYGAALVVLPEERPIPSLAMEKGYKHVTFDQDGNLLELVPFVPQFKPFVRKEG